MSKFERALAATLAYEGGYSEHPKDPGGATMRGITQATYDAWRASQGMDAAPVKGISDGEISAIYRKQYWNAVQGDALPDGVAFAVFDAGVMSGPARAVKWLQGALGVKQDGIVGAHTLAAAAREDAAALASKVCGRRLAFCRGLKTWSTFGRGWENRISAVKRQAVGWARTGEIHAPAASPVPTPRAEPEHRTTPAQSKTIQASAAQLVTAVSSGAGAIGFLDGTAQIVALVGCFLIVLLAVWIMRERLKAWAEGWQ